MDIINKNAFITESLADVCERDLRFCQACNYLFLRVFSSRVVAYEVEHMSDISQPRKCYPLHNYLYQQRLQLLPKISFQMYFDTISDNNDECI